MAAEYRKSKGCFIFHNENPRGLLRSNDCVIRAIAKATGKDWDEVFEQLAIIGLELKDVVNSKPVYDKYLQQLGYLMQKQPRKSNNTKYTAAEFAKKFNKGRYVISLAHHLSVVVDGKIYDTWNCSEKSVGNYWEVK
jgi:hypothetical protein